MEKQHIAITFDVDMMDYLQGTVLDEMELVFPKIQDVLRKYPEVKTTWFIRVDRHTQEIFGSPLYVFEKHPEKLNWLMENGHELGWHFHSYGQYNDTGVQNHEEDKLLEELEECGKLALSQGLEVLRMGGGFHTQRTLALADRLGILIDSSAIPRPKYSWDISPRDWETTGQEPYYPSVIDYRIASSEAMKILEIPMSTVPLSIETDTEEVLRYINTAYYHSRYIEAVEKCNQLNVVTISHPYEVMKGSKHRLLSFDLEEFSNNIKYSRERFNCITISEMANKWIMQQ